MATALDSFYPFIGQTLTNAQWQNYLLLFSTDGVRQTLNSTSALAVVQHGAGDKSVDVSAGRLLLQGNFGENSTTKNLAIASNVSGNPRIDLVVVRITSATPTIQLDILQGTPAGVPVAPTLTQTAATYEVALAQIAVANGFASIGTAQITDKRAWASAQAIRAPSTGSATALPYPSFTSAAPIITLPVSGTTAITSIAAGPAGTILILEFASATCSVANGSNLKLGGNYTSTALGTLTLESDGANWIEVARGLGGQQNPNLVLAGPTTGVGSVAYRALVAADLPLYSPFNITSITQGASTPTFTTQCARYVQYGKTAIVHVAVTLTAAGSAGNAITMTLPAALTMAISGQSTIGSFSYNDTSVTIYTGTVQLSSATTLTFIVSGNANFLGALPNFATANTDTLSFTMQVELA